MVQLSAQVRRRERQQWFASPTKDHLAHFYAQEWMLTACLLDYISEGLLRHETCIVAATPSVLIRLQKGLRELDIDVAAALAHGQYATYDAEEALGTVMDGRSINAEAFTQITEETIIGAIARSSGPIRVYGEMVPVLLKQHNIVAALELEALWEHLCEEHELSMYCAYPESVLLNVASSAAIDSLSRHHSLCVHSYAS